MKDFIDKMVSDKRNDKTGLGKNDLIKITHIAEIDKSIDSKLEKLLRKLILNHFINKGKN